MQIVIILYYFLLLLFLPQQESSVGGLRFHGSEQPIANRTSYNVFDDKPVTFTDQFHIDFRLAFYPNTPIGYILRIKNKDSDRIFNLFFDGQGSSINFNYNEEGKSNLIAAELDTGGIPDMQWTNMRITFDLKGDSIVLSVADREFSVTDVGLPSSYRPVILFGKSDYIIDVPSFAIRDLTVGNASVSYSYALKENEGNNVYENDGKATGKVINPEWLINDAYHWKHEATFHSEPVAGANYNPEKKDFYYFNNDSLQIYNIISGETSVIPFDEDCPVDLVLGTNFLDLDDDKLYAYEVYYDYEYEGPTVASLDLENFRWTAESYTQLPTQLHHHGSFYNPETKNYTIFGGFGNMHYSKNFFSYSLDDNEWYTLEGFTGDVVSPRYFSSVGYLKNENSVYIFGGMGNESGEQTVGRKYYYDLYKVNFDTKHITKLWNIKWELDNIVPVRGMVVLNDSIFYTLGYPEHFTDSFLKLYEFSITDGRYRVLGDSIPIYSDKITTNANLYYDSGLNSLFAVVQEFEDDISSDLKIYSLDFPPITANELFSNSRNVNNREIALIVLLLLGVSIAGITIFLFKRRIGNRTKKKSKVPVIPASTDRYIPVTKSNSIYLFGDFTVCDRNGKNITYMFSAKLKQVLCLVLQYSTEDGISSSHLSEVLWSGKAPSRIKNIRGVTINNLRKALKELDGIELIYERGYFKIVHTQQLYCDYIRCLEIISSSENLEVHRSELIGIIKRGKFLYLANHPLFDSFKEAMEQKLEPVLVVEMEKYYAVKAYQEAIDIADAVFNIDPLNEVALEFQIKAFQKLKQKKEAKVKYQAFLIEYKNTMGIDYPNPMDV